MVAYSLENGAHLGTVTVGLMTGHSGAGAKLAHKRGRPMDEQYSFRSFLEHLKTLINEWGPQTQRLTPTEILEAIADAATDVILASAEDADIKAESLARAIRNRALLAEIVIGSVRGTKLADIEKTAEALARLVRAYIRLKQRFEEDRKPGLHVRVHVPDDAIRAVVEAVEEAMRQPWQSGQRTLVTLRKLLSEAPRGTAKVYLYLTAKGHELIQPMPAEYDVLYNAELRATLEDLLGMGNVTYEE